MLDRNGRWFISAGGQHSRSGAEVPNIIFSGSVPQSVLNTPGGGHRVDPGGDHWGNGVDQWALLTLQMSGTSLTPSVNGKVLGVFQDSSYAAGMVALGCGWHQSYFDKFSAA